MSLYRIFFAHAQMLHINRIQAICRHIDFHTFRGQVYQYKLLQKSNLKLLSHKTAFLLATWPTKRFSELHALSMSKEC